jgi:hypothetical protein
MYSFAQRGDCAVVDEPLYAHYLVNQPTRAIHPARDEILASQPQDGGVVVDWMLHHNFGKKAVIFKQMTHHLVELELGLSPQDGQRSADPGPKGHPGFLQQGS